MAGLPAWLVKALSTPVLGAFVMLLMIFFGLIFGGGADRPLPRLHVSTWSSGSSVAAGVAATVGLATAKVLVFTKSAKGDSLPCSAITSRRKCTPRREATGPDPEAFFQRWSALHRKTSLSQTVTTESLPKGTPVAMVPQTTSTTTRIVGLSFDASFVPQSSST